MDLRPITDTPTAAEQSAIDALLDGTRPQPTSLLKVQSLRHLLLPALWAAQSCRGFISKGALGYICKQLGVPPAEAYGVATFYSMFSFQERPKRRLYVCDDIVCKLRGADPLCAHLRESLGEAGEHAPWQRSPCLGLCEQAPAALITDCQGTTTETAIYQAEAGSLLAAFLDTPDKPGAAQPRVARVFGYAEGRAGTYRLLDRVGKVDPESLNDYRAHGGYQALRLSLEMGPLPVIREITEANLLGRGGAAFPTGRKWEAVARAPRHPHYVVCNADESEPGTFKDRVLLEGDPFSVIEALTICGTTVGAENGYLYIRGEYGEAEARLSRCLESARAHGLLGRDILSRGLSFDIEIRRGAGAYICGEETALFNSIEGFRGEPRNKPPFPVEAGLFGKPTVVNNVETLCNVPLILNQGAAKYRALGTKGSAGTRLFCLCGEVTNPGLYEAPFGISLRQLLAFAGGVEGGRGLFAVLLGGAAGTFLAEGDELDVPLTFEDVRRIGASLGSGVVCVIAQGTDLWPILQRLASFFKEESCGQCVPCRVGTVRQEELIHRLSQGHPLGSKEEDLKLFFDLAQVMRDASICGLGQTAASAIESVFKGQILQIGAEK